MLEPTVAGPRVRVLVVNHDSGPWLARCLASLAVQTMPDFEVVLVDNASRDVSSSAPLPDARFRRLAQKQNLGFAAGNNLAACGAQTPWLALLNPDAIADADWLERLLAEATAYPHCVIFGSTQWRAEEPGRLDGTGDCLSLFGINWRSGYGRKLSGAVPAGEVFAACGAAMMIRRDWFERLGGFETSLFCYVEDLDLCFRARLQGARIRQCATARVLHAGGASSGGGHSPFALYHGNRNLLRVLLRCMPQPWLWPAMAGCLAAIPWRAIRYRRPAQRRALLDAVRDVWRGLPETWRQRRSIQRERSVGLLTVLGWLSVNPADPLRRRFVPVGNRDPGNFVLDSIPGKAARRRRNKG